MDRAEYARKWRAANKDRVRIYYREYARKWREKNRSRKLDDWKQSWRDQWKVKLSALEKIAGRTRPDTCEVCGSARKISFDHDHRTGKFRGWICINCNSVLGFVKDSPEHLEKLVAYLRSSLENVTIQDIENIKTYG